MKNSSKSTRAAEGHTGRVPRIETAAKAQVTPEKPSTLPEIPEGDFAGITGAIPTMRVESVDSAKDADDGVTRSQAGSESAPQPRK